MDRYTRSATSYEVGSTLHKVGATLRKWKVEAKRLAKPKLRFITAVCLLLNCCTKMITILMISTDNNIVIILIRVVSPIRDTRRN